MNTVIVRASGLAFRPLDGRSSADPFAGFDVGGVTMRVVHVAAGGARKPHRHPHSSETIYVVEGTGHFWAEGRAYEVRPGDCVLVAAGVPHATIADRGDAVKLVCFLPHPNLASNIEELDEEIHVDGTRDSTFDG